MKKIGIIGSGVVGKALAAGFIKHGYDIMIGSRDPEKLRDWKMQNENRGRIGTFSETARFGEIIVLCVKGTGAENALKESGAENLAGKTVIDVTNPISETQPPVNGVINFFTQPGESLMEILEKDVPQANFVKAFNIVGNSSMVDPDYGGIKPTMFICGNNENAKKEVVEILDEFGWETEDLGKSNAAGVIESLCILWCIPGFLHNQWGHAFKLLKK